jgi:hypothetical protein
MKLITLYGKDGNGLNNCRNNLRKCLPYQNSANTRVRVNKIYSKYIGVFRGTWKSKNICGMYFKSTITINGKKQELGCFPYTYKGEIMAAKKYNEIALKLRGEFAKTNVIETVL